MARPSNPLRPHAEWLLSQGSTAAQVAEQLGIAGQTVRRWALDLPATVPFAPLPAAAGEPEPPPRQPLRLVPPSPPPPPPVEPQVIDAVSSDELVEGAVGLGWSARVRRGLVERLGLTEDEVDALRVRVIERAGRDLSRAPMEQIAEFTLRIRHAQGVAMRRADLGALTRLLSLEGRVLGMDRLRVDVGVTAEQFLVVAPSTHRLDS